MMMTLIMIAGCVGGSSKPAKHYILSSMKGEEAVQIRTEGDQLSVIGLEPVRLSDYLDRSQIVTRDSSNNIKIAEFDRWAGSFKDNIMRVLVNNLSALGAQYNVSVVTLDKLVPIEYRIGVSISSFEAVSNEQVILDVHWNVFAEDKKDMIISKRSIYRVKISGPGYGDIVAAMSRALEDLSREIADEIKSLP